MLFDLFLLSRLRVRAARDAAAGLLHMRATATSSERREVDIGPSGWVSCPRDAPLARLVAAYCRGTRSAVAVGKCTAVSNF